MGAGRGVERHAIGRIAVQGDASRAMGLSDKPPLGQPRGDRGVDRKSGHDRHRVRTVKVRHNPTLASLQRPDVPRPGSKARLWRCSRVGHELTSPKTSPRNSDPEPDMSGRNSRKGPQCYCDRGWQYVRSAAHRSRSCNSWQDHVSPTLCKMGAVLGSSSSPGPRVTFRWREQDHLDVLGSVRKRA